MTTSSVQQPPQEDSLITDYLPAMHLTIQPAAIKTAHSLTSANFVVPTTVPSTAPAKAVLLNKPKPWTPIQPFDLECELSEHPDKAFVEKLIHGLCYKLF